ncbi:hypothetical protein ACFL6S_05170 [Candidatus Poribacteria bacterium]
MNELIIALGFLVLWLMPQALSAEEMISWNKAKELLVSGKGLSNTPTLGEAVSNPKDYGAEANPTGEPIGGGYGYSRIITSGNYTVGNRQELLDALKKAESGQIVYVKLNAKIDLSSFVHIPIPDGVTLAGNRGQDKAEGPLIYTDGLAEHPYPILFDLGEKARFTGLRLKGPDPDYADYIQQTKDASYKAAARAIAGGTGSEIDNCEISNFYRDGIVANVKDVYIHHNFLHDIAAYPIIVGGKIGTALIEANIIHWGWHSIAGTGTPQTGYEARYNIFKPHTIPVAVFMHVNHCLDQHAYREAYHGREYNGLHIGGDYLDWHHNTIVLDGPSTSPDRTLGMKIRGTPQSLARVYNNWLQTTNISQALGPYGGPREQAHGNVWIYNNVYGIKKQKLTTIVSRTTPQIHLKRPLPPGTTYDAYEKVRGTLMLDMEVNVLEPFHLAGVIVKLDGKELYLNPKAPQPGEAVIDTTKLSNGNHLMTISAIDDRGALGTQGVYVEVAN